MKVRIVQDTYIKGSPVKSGEVLSLDKETAYLLMLNGKAIEDNTGGKK